MYNLQKAKEEIDAVAKHATELTEHVIAIGDVLQSLSASLEGKLEGIRRELHGLMDGKLSEVKQAVLGSDGPLVETSAIADLGAKLSALKNHQLALTAHDQVHEDAGIHAHQSLPPGNRGANARRATVLIDRTTARSDHMAWTCLRASPTE